MGGVLVLLALFIWVYYSLWTMVTVRAVCLHSPPPLPTFRARCLSPLFPLMAKKLTLLPITMTIVVYGSTTPTAHARRAHKPLRCFCFVMAKILLPLHCFSHSWRNLIKSKSISRSGSGRSLCRAQLVLVSLWQEQCLSSLLTMGKRRKTEWRRQLCGLHNCGASCPEHEICERPRNQRQPETLSKWKILREKQVIV